MRNSEGSWELRLLCQDIKDKLYNLSDIPIVVEIGSYSGESSIIFAQEFPFAIIYCIDPWVNGYDDKDIISFADMEKIEKEFDERTKYYKNIVKIKDYSTNINIQNVSMIYIDGNHQYEFVKNDILHWKDKILPNGIISGHDYYDHQEHSHVAGVKKAVLELLGFPNLRYKDGSWIIIKN